MRHPVLTPCCDRRVRWDGDMWYCDSCSRKFMPDRPDFEKPFGPKIEAAERIKQPNMLPTYLRHYALYLAQTVHIF